ncbi:hypothetical protein PSHT_04521 [Puccinia striiformis]|uniref:Uncharacterized protein n=1 Tax=Puccinia striiformis TaxID=27350 RepID=A0A2S4WCW3_9BASI|nr:hypothetical protein PSHT_04521 [Puccinia striiformis]
MEPFPLSESTKLESEYLARQVVLILELRRSHQKAHELHLDSLRFASKVQAGLPQQRLPKLLRRESRKDLYLNTHARYLEETNQKEVIKQRFNLQTVVDHSRICLLRMPDDSAPLQLLGTLPVPPRVVQGQILSRPATVNGSPDGDEDAERLTRLISELELVFMGPT